MIDKVRNSLLEQDNAIVSYLDEMLHEATEFGYVTEDDEDLLTGELLFEEEETEISLPDIDLKEAGLDVAAIEAEFKAEAEREAALESETEVGPEATEAEEFFSLPPEIFPLQCLMFQVAGNMLSIPLIEMRNVIRWPKNLTSLPLQPDWMLGLLQHRGRNLRIADSAKILQVKQVKRHQPKFILVLGGDLGISCDFVDKVVTLEYDDIQWHRKAENHMMLGTIRESLASLLNPRGIVKSLKTELKH